MLFDALLLTPFTPVASFRRNALRLYAGRTTIGFKFPFNFRLTPSPYKLPNNLLQLLPL